MNYSDFAEFGLLPWELQHQLKAVKANHWGEFMRKCDNPTTAGLLIACLLEWYNVKMSHPMHAQFVSIGVDTCQYRLKRTKDKDSAEVLTEAIQRVHHWCAQEQYTAVDQLDPSVNQGKYKTSSSWTVARLIDATSDARLLYSILHYAEKFYGPIWTMNRMRKYIPDITPYITTARLLK